MGQNWQLACFEVGQSWQLPCFEVGQSWQLPCFEVGQSWQLACFEVRQSWSLACFEVGKTGCCPGLATSFKTTQFMNWVITNIYLYDFDIFPTGAQLQQPDSLQRNGLGILKQKFSCCGSMAERGGIFYQSLALASPGNGKHTKSAAIIQCLLADTIV